MPRVPAHVETASTSKKRMYAWVTGKSVAHIHFPSLSVCQFVILGVNNAEGM